MFVTPKGNMQFKKIIIWFGILFLKSELINSACIYRACIRACIGHG